MRWLNIRQTSQSAGAGTPSTATTWTSVVITVTYINFNGQTTTTTRGLPFESGAAIVFPPIIDAATTLPDNGGKGVGVSTSTTASTFSSVTATPSSTWSPAGDTSSVKTSAPSTISTTGSTLQGFTQTPVPPVAPNGTNITQNEVSSGLSPGATAGVAIGMIVVGAAIGFLSAFYLLRRRYAKHPQPEYVAMRSTHLQPHVDDYDGSYASAKAAAAAGSGPSPISPTPTTATLANHQDALQLSHFLLDAAPDKQLAAELSALGHLITQHAEDHYHAAPLPAHTSISALDAALVDTGAFTVNEASTPAQLAAEPRTRRAALQHVIAKVVLGSVVVGGIGQVGMGGKGLSMLPRSVGMFVAEMKPTERFTGNPEVMSLAFTRWRQLSAFLLSPERSDRRALRPTVPEVSRQAREVVHALNAFLAPFIADADHSSNSSSTAGNGNGRVKGQEAHLEEVVLECAKFGYALFSQPGEFRLRFETGRNWNEIVVCPGLEKVSDDQGVRYGSARTLMGPITDGI